MNIRNQNYDNWYLNTFFDSIKVFFILVVVGLICGTIYLKQCTKESEKPNLRVPYNPLYTKPEIADSTKHDWVKDDGVCIERRIVYDQMLNEKLAR